MNIPLILTKKYPGCFWTLDGETYSDLIWQDESPKPTEQDLLNVWEIVKYESNYAAVEAIRQSEYAVQSDPLFFRWKAGSGTEQAWIDARELVKTNNPYPDKPEQAIKE